MTERGLFVDALERTDPGERAAFLDAVCAGKPALRARIEALLLASDDAGAFLDVPAIEQLAAHAGGLPPKHRGGTIMSQFAPRQSLNPRYEECLRLHHCWPWFLVLGAVLMVVGALAISAPYLTALTTLTTVFMCGILLLCGGVVQIVNAFLARSWRGFFLYLLGGILHMVVGLLMVQHPVVAAAGITLLLAALFMVGGAARIIYTLLERFTGWGWVLFNGIVTLLLGILIWQEWPASTEWVIGLFVGIDLLFNGWSWVMLAFLVKDVAPQGAAAHSKDPGSVAAVGS